MVFPWFPPPQVHLFKEKSRPAVQYAERALAVCRRGASSKAEGAALRLLVTPGGAKKGGWRGWRPWKMVFLWDFHGIFMGFSWDFMEFYGIVWDLCEFSRVLMEFYVNFIGIKVVF